MSRRTHPGVIRSAKVLHLGHTGATGGAELALLRMMRAGVGWNPAVLLAPPADGVNIFTQIPPEVPLHVAGVRQPAGVSAGRVSVIIGSTFRLFAQAIVTRLQRDFRRADIVDANTTRSAAYGALAALTIRVPFVVHLRDMVHPDALGRIGALVMRKIVLPRADGVVADTRAALASALPYVRTHAVTAVIPSASALTSHPGATLPPGPLVVGMIARIDPWKGQAELLEAFARALGGSDARLRFAGAAYFGHDDYLEQLRRRATELGLADRVEFLGHVDDVGTELGSWHVAVQASLRPEPLGQNVLQYLAAGRVVIVADEGGPTEWVTHNENGLRTPPRDIAALAATLQRVADDGPLRARLSAAAAVTPGLMDDATVVQSHSVFYAEVLVRHGWTPWRPVQTDLQAPESDGAAIDRRLPHDSESDVLRERGLHAPAA